MAESDEEKNREALADECWARLNNESSQMEKEREIDRYLSADNHSEE
jgi:hypothetical protein